MIHAKYIENIINSPDFRNALMIPSGATIRAALLGAGEYNINYSLAHPKNGKKLIIRINIASQMHLEKQISYEYGALRMLEPCGCTPSVFYVDDSRTLLPHGFLVMEHLPGRPLDYADDLTAAARTLAAVHRLQVDDGGILVAPDDPLGAILDESRVMFAVYKNYPQACLETVRKIDEMLEMAAKFRSEPDERCIVNTELNSGNFLIGEKNYIIDWEKPLYSYAAQDIGHFLAPTTTLWKTETILDDETRLYFFKEYADAAGTESEAALEKTRPFLSVTCMRGITWCAMAWTEYQNPDKLIRNAYTYNKIKNYLDSGFLDMIRRNELTP
jgi:hypothetical protein